MPSTWTEVPAEREGTYCTPHACPLAPPTQKEEPSTLAACRIPVLPYMYRNSMSSEGEDVRTVPVASSVTITLGSDMERPAPALVSKHRNDTMDRSAEREGDPSVS